MSLDWTEVPGWLTAEEGEALAKLASGQRVLELGCYMGRSTLCMGAVADSIVSVDWHGGDSMVGGINTLPRFLENIELADLRRKVIPVIARIEDAAPFLVRKFFDLVFIDSDHHTEFVERDTRLALRCVRPGGVIAWHDMNMTSVQRALAYFDLRPAKQAGSLGWLKIFTNLC